MPQEVQDANNAAQPSSAAGQVADNWDENGRPIVTKKAEPPKTEEPAASETPASKAKPEEKSAEPGAAKQEPKPKAKPSAEERISQLTAERKAAEDRAKDLEERIRNLEAAAKPPAKTGPAKPKEPPKRPNPFTWKGTPEEYEAALEEYEQHRDSQVAARTRQELQQSEAQKSMGEMLKQATAKHPDAEQKIKSATTEIMTKAPQYVQAFVNDSEVLGDLLYTLADQTTLNNLLETAKTNPGKALRVLRDMELDIQKDLSKPPEAKSEEKVPEPKPRAPKPPSEVGGRGAATEDAAVAAARDGKFSDFDAEMSRKHFRQAS
jgi:hypothetical protein